MFGLGFCVGTLIAFLVDALDDYKHFPFKRKEKRRKDYE